MKTHFPLGVTADVGSAGQKTCTPQEGFREEDRIMPPDCDELTFRLYVPIRFQKNQGFGPQPRARLLKTFGFGTVDGIVPNDEVIGSNPE